ncbi:hypothetical protein ACH5RR_010649 [Cinchona calisaya]|uniref:Uncharacterized protein n=1 Tax=Cinchona calisaya TaxID=153742 RepID=A0ABD3AJI5_9GENT
METLVVVDRHRNQYYGKSNGHGPDRFGSFESPPSKEFRGINCRTFQSGSGILPTPVNSFFTPVSKRAFSPSFSPKTASPFVNSRSRSEEVKNLKKLAKSNAISIPVELNVYVDSATKLGGSFSFSERWAGPAYSNSPPPSSLPIPKFSLRPKRTVSLELPNLVSDIDFHPIARSCPASPTRERSPSPGDLFEDGFGVDSATKTLRRILNLDLTDE